ncbi:MAG TPA: hypothetical protein VFO34_04450 [Candidatus Acidoferrales bacterium]|nr:hypothetical protein [Candidatus Acidoferrales bacterium]
MGKILHACAIFFCAAIALTSATGGDNNALQRAAGETHAGLDTRMRNVEYHFSDRIAVHIQTLTGKLVTTPGHSVPAFDDANSFALELTSARIDVPPDSLAAALNEHVFAASDAPLKSIRAQTDGEALKISGKLHSKGDIPFEAKGMLSLDPDGQIRLHVEKVKAAHIPATKLMDLLGVTLSNLIHTKSVQGIRTEGDDLILDPEKTFPPPQIHGKLASIHNDGLTITLQYGDAASSEPSHDAGNYMSYRGTTPLKFGKLTMEPTDLTLLDMNPADPFDFYLDRYKDQLVAGYTKTTPSFGLKVYMRDVNKLPAKK